jgi:hypothetical protein
VIFHILGKVAFKIVQRNILSKDRLRDIVVAKSEIVSLMQKEKGGGIPNNNALLVKNVPTDRKFRVLLVITLVILSVQGWFGDFVNIFVAPSNGIKPPAFTLAGFFDALESLPNSFFPLWHTFEGILLMGLAVAVFALSFKWSKARAVRITSGLGLAAIVSAAVGGFLFVMSGFSNGGNSAQMGGSFTGAYALYFIALYFAK